MLEFLISTSPDELNYVVTTTNNIVSTQEFNEKNSLKEQTKVSEA